MREVFINIFSLFYKANPDSPYGLDRADEYNENRAVYEAKIEHFTKKYGNPIRIFKQNPTEDWDFSI